MLFCTGCLEAVGTAIAAILVVVFFLVKGLWWVLCKVAIFIWWVLCGIGGCIGGGVNGCISGCSSTPAQTKSGSNVQAAQVAAAKPPSPEEVAERNRVEAARRTAEAERKRMEAERKREDTLRDFALKEAPRLWQTYQTLNAAIDEQHAKIEDLRSELKRFGRNPYTDDDVKNLSEQLGEWGSMRDRLREKLEKAYVQSLYDAATPDKGTADGLRKKALDDGLRIAEEVERRFGKMREMK